MELGNQQASPIEIGYLCGIIDGEGTITISKSNRRKNGKHNLHPYMSVQMRHFPTIERIRDILNNLGVGAYIYMYQSKGTHMVHCGGYKRLGSLLPIVIPHLVEKRERAEIVLRYIERRKSMPHKSPYSNLDYEDQKEVARLNIKPKHREESLNDYPKREYSRSRGEAPGVQRTKI